MSGGVDSCVSAAMLAEAGHDVVGITMRVVPDEAHENSVFQPCCSAEMAKDARQVADLFGFPHFTINLVDNFEKQVVDDFIGEYQEGRTPNPCVRCNQRLKFGTLYKKAVELEASYIATGHYVRNTQIGDRHCIQRAVYEEKDQSYVMAGLSQKQIAMGLFPLGEMTKEETREKARSLGLTSAETPESQDICFIPDNNYKGFLRKRVGAMPAGEILSVQGTQLGTHTGLGDYTVGQRKGLGIASPHPLYVVALDVQRNAIVVGSEEETYCRNFVANEIVWGGLPPRGESFRGYVQIRYRHMPVACAVTPVEDGLEFVFDEPERSVTPGQWAVVYDDEKRVLASGIISRFESVGIEEAAREIHS